MCPYDRLQCRRILPGDEYGKEEDSSLPGTPISPENA